MLPGVIGGLIGVCTEEGGQLTINFKDNKLWPGYTVTALYIGNSTDLVRALEVAEDGSTKLR